MIFVYVCTHALGVYMSTKKSIFVLINILFFSQLSFAQNTWGPYTRPITRILSDLSPNSVHFENNLMNHISDELRVDDSKIRKKISCFGNKQGVIDHHKSGRHVRIQCDNTRDLTYIKDVVSKFYNKGIGGHLKYAFRSGPYIFALCNYDSHGEHKHSKEHYVCRTPISGESKERGVETFCYNMGFFHRTCNPHKALVATEIIPINSTMRWETLDKTILTRSMGRHLGAGNTALEIMKDIAKSKVVYKVKSRGSSDADIRYPKFFIGKRYACVEQLQRSSKKYVETLINCGDISKLSKSDIKALSSDMIRRKPVMSKTMKRLKQIPAKYPLLNNMKSSIDI